MSKIFPIIVLLILVCFTFSVLAQRETVPSDPKDQEKPIAEPSAGNTPKKDDKKKRQREGTVFTDKKVTFRPTGSRTTMFAVEGDERFVVLENLNLERVLKAIEEKPSRSVWKVDGVYTEFHGENYVLLQRAVALGN
jgi:hypothetical protein